MGTWLPVVSLALVAVWMPLETAPWAGVVAAAIALMLVPAAWDRTSRAGTARALCLAGPLTVWVAAGWLTGWDLATGTAEWCLIVATAGTVWLASRRRPGDRALALLAAGVALLALWGLWQVVRGFTADLGGVAALPEALQAAARHRLLTGRGFASQTQPGHLAVLLATVVPLAVSRLARARGRAGLGWGALLVLSGGGIVLTRSVLGAALALAAAVAALPRAGGRGRRLIPVVLVAALAVVVVGRADLLARAEPIQQRLENWHAALWVWSGSPVSGVGLGGLGQAALAAPFPMGNHPLHAHNLPLELAADLGPPGILAGAAFFIWIACLSARVRALDRGLAVAVLVVPLHNLFDFSLYMWGVAIVWAVLAGWAQAIARGRDCPPAGELARWRPLAVATAAVLVAAAVLNATGATLEEGAATAVTPARRLELAERARAVAPWRQRSLHTLAALAEGRGPEAAAAAAELERARRWRSHSPALALALARAAAARGDLPANAREAFAAVRTAPPGSALAGAAARLLDEPEPER